MDDDKLMRDIDFSHFEEEFKLSTTPVVKKGVNDTTAPDGAQTGITNGTGTIRYNSNPKKLTSWSNNICLLLTMFYLKMGTTF